MLTEPAQMPRRRRALIWGTALTLAVAPLALTTQVFAGEKPDRQVTENSSCSYSYSRQSVNGKVVTTVKKSGNGCPGGPGECIEPPQLPDVPGVEIPELPDLPRCEPGQPGEPEPSNEPEPGPSGSAPSGGGNEADCLNSEERAFLDLINAYRARNGAPKLAASRSLNAASYLHSKDMGERGYFEHASQDGRSPWDRMKAQGYPGNTAMSENVAAGQPTAQAVFESWRGSAGHNRNMLNPDMRAIGIGLASVSGSPYGEYWTTDFGGTVDEAPRC